MNLAVHANVNKILRSGRSAYFPRIFRNLGDFADTGVVYISIIRFFPDVCARVFFIGSVYFG